MHGIFYSGRAYVQFLSRPSKNNSPKVKLYHENIEKKSMHERNVLLVMITRIAITKTTIVVS